MLGQLDSRPRIVPARLWLSSLALIRSPAISRHRSHCLPRIILLGLLPPAALPDPPDLHPLMPGTLTLPLPDDPNDSTRNGNGTPTMPSAPRRTPAHPAATPRTGPATALTAGTRGHQPTRPWPAATAQDHQGRARTGSPNDQRAPHQPSHPQQRGTRAGPNPPFPGPKPPSVLCVLIVYPASRPDLEERSATLSPSPPARDAWAAVRTTSLCSRARHLHGP